MLNEDDASYAVSVIVKQLQMSPTEAKAKADSMPESDVAALVLAGRTAKLDEVRKILAKPAELPAEKPKAKK